MILDIRDKVVIKLTNKTGSASVKGQVVKQSADTDENYEAAPAGGIVACGVVLVGGIPDGQKVPICILGKCQVLFGTGVGATRGNWATISSSEAGMATSLYVEGGNVLKQGLGMTLETVAGVELTNKLVWVAFVPSKSEDVPVANSGG